MSDDTVTVPTSDPSDDDYLAKYNKAKERILDIHSEWGSSGTCQCCDERIPCSSVRVFTQE